MAKATNWGSKVKVILRCTAKQKIFKILLPIALLFILLSSHFNMQAKKLFLSANNFYIDLKYEDGFYHYQWAMGTVVFHYILSQISGYLIGYCSLIVLKAFLVQSLQHSIDLEYSKFHSKGIGRVQDSIIRSSQSASDLFPIIFFEFTWSAIDITYSIYEIWKILNFEYFLKLMMMFIVGFMICVVVAIYSYKQETKTIGLFKNSILPLTDTLNNIDVVKSFNKEESEIEKYKQSLAPFQFESYKYFFFINILKFFQKCLLLFPNIVVYYFASHGQHVWRTGVTDVKIIITFNNLFSTLKKDLVSLRDHIFSYLKIVSHISTDPTLFQDVVKPNNEVIKKDFNVSITLEKVHLYAGNNLVQKNQSFQILKNQKVAITGDNGCGKSVFMKSLLKFFKNEGKFYIDDVLLENVTAKSVRELISYVPQESHIFNTTVLANLGYSQKTIDEQKIFTICETYGLHSFFKSLKDGYHTIAGEKGRYLSGGQKQRIAFMRGIIKDAPIILMDEPTASIDQKSEFEMVNKVLDNCKDRTFILIVHNQSILNKFDKIIHFCKEGITCYDNYENYKNRDN